MRMLWKYCRSSPPQPCLPECDMQIRVHPSKANNPAGRATTRLSFWLKQLYCNIPTACGHGSSIATSTSFSLSSPFNCAGSFISIMDEYTSPTPSVTLLTIHTHTVRHFLPFSHPTRLPTKLWSKSEQKKSGNTGSPRKLIPRQPPFYGGKRRINIGWI